MSDEVQVTDNADETTPLEGESQEDNLSAEEWKNLALKYRKEAAARRVKKKDVDAKLQEYEDWKKSQMSEVDRIKAEKAEVEREVAAYRKEKLQVNVAEKAGLDLEFADLIQGDSEDEMLAEAKRLKARLGPKGATTADMRPGARGAAVGSKTDKDMNEWFRGLFNTGS